ncbi:MAG: hypothetical protein K1W22_05015 [Lachnospiraceae bacterium]
MQSAKQARQVELTEWVGEDMVGEAGKAGGVDRVGRGRCERWDAWRF